MKNIWSSMLILASFDASDPQGQGRNKRLQDNAVILRTIIEETEDPIYVKDREGRYLMINAAGARAVGRPVEEIIGQDDTVIFLQEDAQRIMAHDREVVTNGEAQTFEEQVVVRSETRVYHSLKTPYRDERGNVIGVVGVSRNISAVKQGEQFYRLLAEAGEILATSLDYSTRLAHVAHLAVPRMADWCSVSLCQDDGSIQQVVVAHKDPAKVTLAQELQRRYPIDMSAPTGLPNVLRTGQSEFYPVITDEMLEAAARDAEHLQILRDLQMNSVMIVPLLARGRSLGAMTFVWAESGQHYDVTDLALAEELARRIAISIDNARLYEAEQRMRRATERIATLITSLQAVTAALSGALTLMQVAEVVIEYGLAVSGAKSGIIVLLDEQGENLEILHSFGYSEQQVENLLKFPLTASAPLPEAIRTAKPLYIESWEELAELYPEFYVTSIARSSVSLPLIIEEKAIGGIGLSFAEAQSFSEEDRSFLLSLARLCAQALERARLYELEKKARAEAEAAQQRLTLLAEAEERNRLAQDLHDNIAQTLGYLNLQITVANTQLAEGEYDKAQANLKELKQIVSEAYTDVREEIFNLRANVSSQLLFLETLRSYLDKYKRFYNLDVQLLIEADEAAFAFSNEVGLQIFRIIQEALINIRKHALVKWAVIRLSQQAGQIRISIEDAGEGFNLEQMLIKGNSFGLKIIRERAERIDSHLKIESVTGQGTKIILYYPTRDEEKETGQFA